VSDFPTTTTTLVQTLIYSYCEGVWEMIGKEAQELLTTNNSQTH
jgi:hypothetical protein